MLKVHCIKVGLFNAQLWTISKLCDSFGISKFEQMQSAKLSFLSTANRVHFCIARDFGFEVWERGYISTLYECGQRSYIRVLG